MMKTIQVQRPAIQLIGIEMRTNNNSEMDAATAKIGKTIQHYIETNKAAQIPNRLTPGTTYCVYTDYYSDYIGDYTYFIGEAVAPGTKAPVGLTTRTIPAQIYCCLTTKAGVMPAVCINAWQTIWNMSSTQLGGHRSYVADFEIYDVRATDPEQTILDIYIGITP